MRRPSIRELEACCQKPDHRRIGNWLARRVSRPMALRVTWVVHPWGVSAHMTTCAAWLFAIAGAVSLAFATPGSWVLAAVCLHVWYLLDHVDGQLARLRGTASLAGAQLDYLMHHTVNVMIPLGAGYGLSRAWDAPLFMVSGVAWALGGLTLGLIDDTRQKTFEQRLKRVVGELRAIGGGAARPVPPAQAPREPLRLAAWCARKACEVHTTLLALTAVAICQWLAGDVDLHLAAGYTIVMGALAVAVATLAVAREIRLDRAETQFAAWFQPPAGHDLLFEKGWWIVRPSDASFMSESAGRDASNSGLS